MCGRYTLTRQEDLVEDLEAALGESAQGEWWKPRFNVAPTQPAPVVLVKDGARTIELLRWGLVPFWARAGAKPPLMINARLESVADKAVFRDALDRKRCLVPADGFFEWLKEGKARHPFYLHPSLRRTIAFAGLWARARTDAGELLSFTIITGPANELVAPIHDRMPVVLDPGSYAAWLDPSVGGDAARKLLGVPPVADWVATPVSQHVNSAQHDDPSCIAPPDAAKQGTLFD
ncbi:MAG TPA: SOS response-associated peptidase [Kofleriaceae bacterium]|jgi:putative SOS response-associated peptidase YedK|nr:SOS response-associated peptidase [Kofleriaceae bacterium]